MKYIISQLKRSVFLMVFVSTHVLANTDLLDMNIEKSQSNQDSSKQSQQKVDALYEQKREALYEMRGLNAEIEQLEVYNRQLREIIANQEKQIDSLNNQISEIETTQQGIMPLMERMLNGLEQFIQLDLPFLLNEREQRIATLRSLLLASDVTVSEKFRRVLEAYQIEIEYGRTIESYRETGLDGVTVDILRIGRNALFSLTLDQQYAKAFDKHDRKWVDLDDGYVRSIKQGVAIARKQAAPSLLELPVQLSGGAKQ